MRAELVRFANLMPRHDPNRLTLDLVRTPAGRFHYPAPAPTDQRHPRLRQKPPDVPRQPLQLGIKLGATGPDDGDLTLALRRERVGFTGTSLLFVTVRPTLSRHCAPFIVPINSSAPSL